jgi:hypothetical protein
MKRRELEHVLRAAANTIGQRDFLVIGTASILGTYDEGALPERAIRSREADLAPFNENAQGGKSMLVEGALGDGSQFQLAFGYYADGVDFGTVIAPYGWKNRLVRFSPPGAEPGCGWCLDVYDLSASKLAAGRAKDYEFVGALLDAGLIDIPNLLARVSLLPKTIVSPAYLNKAMTWINRRSQT